MLLGTHYELGEHIQKLLGTPWELDEDTLGAQKKSLPPYQPLPLPPFKRSVFLTICQTFSLTP
jgi:hypothetical protein